MHHLLGEQHEFDARVELARVCVTAELHGGWGDARLPADWTDHVRDACTIPRLVLEGA